MCVVTTRDEAERRGLRPLLALRSWAVAGVGPEVMGIGPVPATAAALARAGLTLDDLDLHRAQRGLRRPGARLPARVEGRPDRRAAQPQRLGHLARPPGRRHRRADPGHDGPRDAAPRAAATGWRRCASAAARASPRSSRPCDERPAHGRSEPTDSMSLDKVVAARPTAVADIPSGASLAVGGFGLAGIPWFLIEALLEQGADDLTVVSNNCGVDGAGLGLLLERGRISRVIASYVGENKEFARQYLAGELTVELTPQGTLAERLRAGGAGIGRVLHPDRRRHAGRRGRPAVALPPRRTVALASPPKEVRTFHGREMVLEESIVTDVALVRAAVADRAGNCVFHASARNFNPAAAMAGRTDDRRGRAGRRGRRARPRRDPPAGRVRAAGRRADPRAGRTQGHREAHHPREEALTWPGPATRWRPGPRSSCGTASTSTSASACRP